MPTGRKRSTSNFRRLSKTLESNMSTKYADNQCRRSANAWLSVGKVANQYGEFVYLRLEWRNGKKKKAKSLGPVDERNPTLTLDVVIRAIELKLLSLEELLRLRSANKAARW
jgi:hypothetical protein